MSNLSRSPPSVRQDLQAGLRPPVAGYNPSLHPSSILYVGFQAACGKCLSESGLKLPEPSRFRRPEILRRVRLRPNGLRPSKQAGSPGINPLRRLAKSLTLYLPFIPPALGRLGTGGKSFPASAHPRRTEEASPGGGGTSVYWRASKPRGRGWRSQRRHAVAACVPWQAQSELSAHVVGHEPAGHEVVAPREAASAALGQ